MAKNSRFSLRVSLATTLMGAVLMTSLLLGVVMFTTWRQSLRDGLNQRLSELAGTVVLLIDPKDHASLKQPSDMDGSVYRTLRDKLTTVRKLSPEIRYLYTFRWTASEEHPRFVLDTGTPGTSEFSPLGEIYDTMTPTLEASFRPPYTTRIETDFYTDSYGTWLSAFSPVLREDGSLEALVGLDMDASNIVAMELRLMLLVAGITFAITIFMGILSWWFSRRISRPLLELSADMARIQEFRLDGEVSFKTRISEVSTMQTSLENMKRGLRSFKKYVPSDLVAELIGLQKEATLGTEKHEITTFFCDLENFTNASERLSPEALNALLSTYFESVTQTLQSHGATVDKFIGDAVMAFWNAPRPTEDHAFAGAKAALAVQSQLEELRKTWKAQGLPNLATRIGLNSGTVMVGNVGHVNRLSYTALGDAVNLASRLESLNKYYGTHLLAGEETVKALKGKIAYRPIDRVAVKGKTKGTLIAELVLRAPSWWVSYFEAWKAYSQSEWKNALAIFETLPDDGPSKVLASRCKRFLDDGVPNDWTGVWVMNDK